MARPNYHGREAMTHQKENDSDGLEVKSSESEPLVLETLVGAVIIPDLEALTAALGDEVLAYQATENGLFYLSAARRWINVEAATTGPKVARLKN